MRNVHICSFSTTDELKGRKLTYENLKAVVLKAGRFSAFEASDTPKRASLFTRLCRDPELVCDNTRGYPWVYVTRSEETE